MARAKSGKLVIVEPSGTVTLKEVAKASLEALQEAVGGYIEPVGFANRGKFTLVVNEEGLIQRLPIQRFGNWEFAGNVVIVRANGLGALNDAEVEEALDLYGIKV